jgi:hypothetical protein
MAIGFPAVPTLGQQWPTVSPKWEFDGSTWFALTSSGGIVGATPITARLTSLFGSDDLIAIRADVPYLVDVDTVSAGPIVATAPSAFTAGQWAAEATVVAGQIRFNISALPSNGGSAITSLEYRVGTGVAIAFTGTGTGIRVVTAGLSAGVAVDLQVRAVNAIGASAWSDPLNRTPLASGGAGDLNFVKASTARQGEFGNSMSQTFGSNVVEGNHVLAVFATSPASVPSGAGATLDSTSTLAASALFGLRTPTAGAAFGSVAAYSLAPSDNWGGVAIEVAGNAPVFDAVFSQAETVGSGGTRTLNITVAQDNSIVLFIASGDNDRTLTHVGGLTSLSAGVSYHPVAWGKFDAGVHALQYTPNANANYYGAAAFVWSPGP